MIYLNDDIAHFDFEKALPLLSRQRREQALKFKYELGRKTCAAAYLLLREGLRKEYGILEPPVFEYGEHGKPMLSGYPHIHFNMSHCREAAICVVSDRPVGVDIESIREYKESLARYTMNDAEMEYTPDHWLACLGDDVWYCSDRWCLDRLTRCHWLYRKYMECVERWGCSTEDEMQEADA
jgi:4'-phosphopantetheinyl transferase EntD